MSIFDIKTGKPIAGSDKVKPKGSKKPPLHTLNIKKIDAECIDDTVFIGFDDEAMADVFFIWLRAHGLEKFLTDYRNFLLLQREK